MCGKVVERGKLSSFIINHKIFKVARVELQRRHNFSSFIPEVRREREREIPAWLEEKKVLSKLQAVNTMRSAHVPPYF